LTQHVNKTEALTQRRRELTDKRKDLAIAVAVGTAGASVQLAAVENEIRDVIAELDRAELAREHLERQAADEGEAKERADRADRRRTGVRLAHDCSSDWDS
jgi:hypothetical protein